MRSIVTFVSSLVVAMPVALGGEPARTDYGSHEAGSNAVKETPEEVVVSGRRSEAEVADLIPWLRRLVDQYHVTGYIELYKGGTEPSRAPVTGRANCVGFGPAPGVECRLDVRWPGSIGEQSVDLRNLSPGMALFGIEPNEPAIRFLLVNSKGIAEPGYGRLFGDTLVAKEPCVEFSGNCQRATNIAATQGADVVQVQISIEVDYRRALRINIDLHRGSLTQTGKSEAPPK